MCPQHCVLVCHHLKTLFLIGKLRKERKFPDQLACVSQKSRKLLVPENFSGRFSGAFLGFRKAFLKAPDFLPRFSGMFSGNVTQGIARASIFQPVIGSKIAIDTVALSWVRHVRIKFKTFSMSRAESFISSDLYSSSNV